MAIEILKFKIMKKILVYLPLVVLFISCENSDVKYADFTYQTVYFPVQNPVRTLVFGDELQSDNSIDLQNAFTIAANVGGLYENIENRDIGIRLAPELVPTDVTQLLITNTTPADTLEILPASHYDASSLSNIQIPAGKFDGRIRINLTDAFFKDVKSVKLKYVLPLLIENDRAKTKDSVLTGVPVGKRELSSRTKVADWQTGKAPKDYVLFAINYANKYHGNYFHYGLDSIFKGTVYSKRTVHSKKPDIEVNPVTLVTTTALDGSTINRLGGINVGPQFRIGLTFNPDKSISISSVKGSIGVSSLTGSGKFIEKSDGIAWGGKKHKTIYLKYQWNDAAGDTHKSYDTLVYRTSGVVYKDFTLK